MRALFWLIQVTVLLAISTSSAQAYTQAWAGVYDASQDGTSNRARVGLIADATTDMAKLFVGGGYTLTCEGSSTTAPAQRSLTVNKPFFQNLVSQDVDVPATLPAKYPIAGFESWVAGERHQCTFAYKGIAAGTSSGVSVTLTGGGVSISFSGGPAEPAEEAETEFFDMVKPYPPPPPRSPPPCTPGFNCCYP